MISAQPAQKASGWWKASPWLARRWSGVIVCQQECRSGGSRGLLPLPLRRQGEAGRGCSRFGLIQQHPSPALPCLRRGESKARRWLLARARARIPRGAELGVGDPVRPALRVRQTAAHRVELQQGPRNTGDGSADGKNGEEGKGGKGKGN